MGEACFHPLQLRTGGGLDLRQDAFPSRVQTWDASEMELFGDGTSFGFLQDGEATLTCELGKFPLRAGMYFSLPQAGRVEGQGRGLVITQLNYQGLFQLGGPVEEQGRLQYIDGCTDTLLISPVRWGDPCLNLLHIPPGTEQTQHTHPSFRAGVIVSGHGQCITPSGDFELSPGLAFVIPAEGLHSFHTQEEALRVIAYHPDSDFGPTDEAHPMINRTIIPAHEMPSVRS